MISRSENALPRDTHTHVSICVCTRDRGAEIVLTLRSVLSSTYPDFDVVLVDQSGNDDTRCAALAAIGTDPRYTYVSTESKGLSAARNIAMTHARGEIIAFTDDDVEVPPQWIEAHVRCLEQHPQVGLVCGEVRAAPHDTAVGFIPDFPIRYGKVIMSRWLRWRDVGIGANMVFRRAALDAAGHFDELLGVGAPLQAGEDTDMLYRVLKAGYAVLLSPEAYVIHYGFRLRQDTRGRRQSGSGVGAAYMKQVRLGEVPAVYALIQAAFGCVSWRRVFLFRRSSGLRFLLHTAKSALLSFRYPIDRAAGVYRQPKSSSWSRA